MNLGRKNDVTKQLQTSKTCEGETEKDTTMIEIQTGRPPKQQREGKKENLSM